MKSKDITPVSEAVKELKKLKNKKVIKAFLEGETRKTVLDAAKPLLDLEVDTKKFNLQVRIVRKYSENAKRRKPIKIKNRK